MPNIDVAGTLTKETPGFEFLGATRESPVLLFAGNSADATVQYLDDAGTWRTFENGAVTTLPNSMIIEGIKRDLRVVVTGTPDFNLTGG